MNDKEPKRKKRRWETREASTFESDRAAQMGELSAQMRACALCVQGEESSKTEHLIHFVAPEGLVPECSCPFEYFYFTHWPDCPKRRNPRRPREV